MSSCGPKKRLSRSSRLRVAAWAAPFILSAAALSADTLHLKNGDKIVGIIDQKLSDDQRVAISTTKGMMKVARQKIEHIEMRENADPDEVRGDVAANSQNFDSAMEYYEKALAKQPDNKELEEKIDSVREMIKERDEKRFAAQFDRMDELVNEREFETAIQMARELAQKADTPSARQSVLNKLASIYLEQARDFRNTVNYPETEKAYRNAIEANRDGAVPQLELAEMVRKSPTRFDEAFALYKEGIENAERDDSLLTPEEVMKYRYAYAELHLKAKKYREAADLAWAVAMQDTRGQYFQALDIALASLSSVQEELTEQTPENNKALEMLLEISNRRPTDDRSPYIAAKSYYRRADYKTAISPLERALRNMGSADNSSDYTDALYYLAISYRQVERDRDAVTQLLALLEVQPKRYEAICELAEIYTDLGEFEKAVTRFKDAIAVEPTSYRAFLGAARTLRRIKRDADAALMYEELIKLKNDNPDYFFELGVTYFDLQRYEDSNKMCLKVAELMVNADQSDALVKERLADVYMYLGLTSVAMKKYNEGIEQFNKSLDYRPDAGRVINGKGLAYQELNQIDKAEECFVQALKITPNSAEYLLNMGVLHHKFRKDTQKALPFYQQYYENGGNDPQVAQWIRECGGTPPA